MKVSAIVFLLTYLVFSKGINADTLTVKLDGSGQFTSIMAAVSHASDGDVVLVYPGTYVTNIDFFGKNITIAGTWLINPVDSLISMTTIDGHQNGSCVTINRGEQNARLVGLRLVNGSGRFVSFNSSSEGGGVYIREVVASIEHCIIENNSTIGGGGGLFIHSSDVQLKGNVIRYNRCNYFGGGMYITSSSNVSFDPVELNSLFMNYSQLGTDLSISYTSTINHIALDTATVSNLNRYYLIRLAYNTAPINDLTFSANNGKLESVNADLYVSPAGNNNNTGLSPEQPLKNIAFALLKIQSDTLHPKTIYLSEGVFSPELTGEHLPFCFKSHVYIVGAGRDESIIDAESKSSMGLFPFGEKSLKLSHFTFRNGNGHRQPLFYQGGFVSYVNQYCSLDNLKFSNNRAWPVSSAGFSAIDTVLVNNCLFENNKSVRTLQLSNSFQKNNTFFEITSCIIRSNLPDSTDDIQMPVSVFGLEPLLNGNGYIHGHFINSELTDNASYYEGILPSGFGISSYQNATLTIVNATIGNNLSMNEYNGSAIGVGQSSVVKVYNSIVYGNYPYQAHLINDEYELRSSLYVYHSVIQDGLGGINDLGSYNYVYYDSSNIDQDPLWHLTGDYPYALTGLSPCIDAGTLDLPEGIVLPATDLAGNPRVWGGAVDIGAYEYNPVGIGFGQQSPKNDIKLLSAYPNPFGNQITVTASYPKASRMLILVYDAKGVMVKTLADIQTQGGRSEINWNGSNDAQQILPVGVYQIVMLVDNKQVDSKTIVKTR